MNLSDVRLPRDLEADGTAEKIRLMLMARTVQLWSGSDRSVPVITISDTLKRALQKANIEGNVRCGLEAISAKLEKERKGITHLQEEKGIPSGERVSRLFLISSDGSPRFYRHIEHILELHAPRILGCMLEIDGNALGTLITGKERQVKVIMVEHKEAVSQLLRALLEDQPNRPAHLRTE
jgi:hypothetical protein